MKWFFFWVACGSKHSLHQSPANDQLQETVGKTTSDPPQTRSFTFSLSLSDPLCQNGLSFYPSLLSPPFCSSPLHPPSPWLERVASECQMYYRVRHSNVNTQPCHESRVVWPPSFSSLPLHFTLPLSPPSHCWLPEGWRKYKTAVCMCWGWCWTRSGEEPGV